MRVIFVGDVVGRPGRNAVAALLPKIRVEHKIDFAIVNGENSAGGAGLTLDIARELNANGADVVTNGNHVWDQRQFLNDIELLPFAIRPINLAPGNPGRGFVVIKDVLVVNAIGRTFMAPADDPFRAIDDLLDQLGRDAPRVRVLDWHAEATSEKVAMGWHLDGRALAVFGTHTHVPTADARVLPNGTAYISDVGMTGARGGVIGVRREQALERFRTMMPVKFETADEDLWVMGCLVEADESGRATSIEQLMVPYEGS